MYKTLLSVQLVTPRRELFGAKVTSVLLPGEKGPFQVLPGHANFLTTLATGIVELELDNASHCELYSISGGYAEVDHDTVTILADTCEQAAEIDVPRAEQAYDKALAELRNPKLEEEMRDFWERKFERARIRLMVAAMKSAQKS